MDEGRYVAWANKNQPDRVYPRFSAWQNFKFSVGGALVFLAPIAFLLLLGWVLLV